MHTILYPVNELKIGGAEQQLLELVRGLDKTRFRPIVAPLYGGGALTGEFQSVPGVELIDLHRRGKYDIAPFWQVGRLLRTRRVDIVQPFLTPATLFGLLPALVVGTPVTIVTERCGVRRTRHAGYKLYRSVEDWLTHHADAVVANSAAGMALLRERGIPAVKIRVIYNGVNHERLTVDPSRVAALRTQLDATADAVVIGILASLTPAKDHATLLRALAIVSRRHPSIRCAVIGDGPLRSELEALAASLGLAERVVFFGYQRRVAEFLAACDLLVSSSRDNEGCSNSVLEAMALSKPVIATDVGGNCELVTDGTTGFLTPVADPAAMATKIELALTNRAHTHTMAERARQMVATRFSLTRMVSDYEYLYEELLQASSAQGVKAEIAQQ